jgi:hypothetical protein
MKRPQHSCIPARGISCRDDSILVNGYRQGVSETFTVRRPEFFAHAHGAGRMDSGPRRTTDVGPRGRIGPEPQPGDASCSRSEDIAVRHP